MSNVFYDFIASTPHITAELLSSDATAHKVHECIDVFTEHAQKPW
jgi:hypothetical protein